jgi:hypothetical protein
MKKGYWVYSPKPVKFTKDEKEELKRKACKYIALSKELEEKTSRIEVKSNRIYLYELVEQFISKGAQLIKPLINDKYLEFPLGRITLHDANGEKCTTDWQRHNGQWISLYNGDLENCIKYMYQEGSAWFLH